MAFKPGIVKILKSILLLFFTTISAFSSAQDRYLPADPYNAELPDSIYDPYPDLLKAKSALRLLDSVFYLLYESSISDWVNYNSSTHNYNNCGEAEVSYNRNWNSNLLQWDSISKAERSYNDNLLVSNTISEWSAQTESYAYNSKYEYYYDENFLLDHYIIFSWNSDHSKWDSVSKYLYLFDINKNLVNYKRQYWSPDASGFITDYQFVYEYLDNKRTGYTRQKWDLVNSIWLNQTHNGFDYNASGTINSELQSKWNNDLLSWEYSTMISYTYSENEKPVEKLYQSWTGSDWTNTVKYDYSYNENLQNYLINFFIWNNPEWEEKSRYLYQYDDIFGDLVSEEYHNMTTGSWHYVDRFEYYYSLHQVSVKDISGVGNLTVSPNPFSDQLFIRIRNMNLFPVHVEIYNLTGRKLYSKTISGDETELDLSYLQAGIYILRIGDNKHSYFRKVIKAR